MRSPRSSRGLDKYCHNSIGERLGAGQFGTVEEGTWNRPTQPVQVAIKTLQGSASAMDRIRFLQEAAIMAQFKHPNVVTLYGVAQKDGRVCYNKMAWVCVCVCVCVCVGGWVGGRGGGGGG